MNVQIRRSFLKDAARLPVPFQHQLAEIIEDMEQAVSPRQLVNCKKLKGHKTAYRIRMGAYRVGFYHTKQNVELVRVLDRNDIYRYFPEVKF